MAWEHISGDSTTVRLTKREYLTVLDALRDREAMLGRTASGTRDPIELRNLTLAEAAAMNLRTRLTRTRPKRWT